MQGEIEPTRGEIETNIGKLEKLKFPFWVEGSIGGCGRVWGCGLDHGVRVWGCGLDHGSRVSGRV